MKEYLLQSFANADVFVHAPFDKDSYKLSILKDIPNLVHFRIFKPETISEPRTYTDILTASNSPHGIQVLFFEYFMVDVCRIAHANWCPINQIANCFSIPFFMTYW